MRTRGWQGDLPQDEHEARARILAAAAQCVERMGPAKTRLADVADELGVTRQTVYRYFPTVKVMLAAVAQEGIDDYLDRMATDLAMVTTVGEAVSETIIYCLHSLPDEPALGLLLRAGETEFFTQEATSPQAVSLGSKMLRRLPIDWSGRGFDDSALAGLAEVVMRLFLSFLQYPTDPPRSDADLRAFIRAWIVTTPQSS